MSRLLTALEAASSVLVVVDERSTAPLAHDDDVTPLLRAAASLRGTHVAVVSDRTSQEVMVDTPHRRGSPVGCRRLVRARSSDDRSSDDRSRICGRHTGIRARCRSGGGRLDASRRRRRRGRRRADLRP
ncbi:MAG: hypothetical protein R2713_18015 [Ilumatobacteraceae bacterium]